MRGATGQERRHDVAHSAGKFALREMLASFVAFLRTPTPKIHGYPASDSLLVVE